MNPFSMHVLVTFITLLLFAVLFGLAVVAVVVAGEQIAAALARRTAAPEPDGAERHHPRPIRKLERASTARDRGTSKAA